MPTTTHTAFRVEEIRKDFPTLHQEVYGKPLVYFDNAATSQKPQPVIDAVNAYYQKSNSNVHRGVHYLSQQATDLYEHTRVSMQQFLNAKHQHEIIYTKGTTEGINLVAYSFGEKYVKEGDEIVISAMEHHANIVPWQLLAERKGAKVRVIPVNEKGEMDVEAYMSMLNERTRIVAMVHTSNSLGTVNPIEEVITAAHAMDIPVLVDGAQAVPHGAVDVQAMDCDFFVFSGHKMLGPTGTGILYGKEKWLEEMPPFIGGGDMIDVVRFEGTTFAGLPHKFEAGTPNIAGMVGLDEAVKYMQKLGYEQIAAQENDLLAYGTKRLSEIEGIRFVGTAAKKTSVISFVLGDIHPYDAGVIMDRLGIAIRTGHHCTQPILAQYGLPGTMRASFAFYNTREEIDRMMKAIEKVLEMFGK